MHFQLSCISTPSERDFTAAVSSHSTALIWLYVGTLVLDKANLVKYSRLSLSRPRLSRITAYLEVKIWSLPKHENLTTGKKYCGKEEKLLLRSNFSSFRNIFNISVTSRVQLHIYLLNVVVRIIFFLSSVTLICRGTDISKCFRESHWNSR